MHGYIYKTTNLLNGRTYVGQHAAQQFEPDYLGSGKLLRAAVSKYGVENFKVEVLEWCATKTLLDEAEKRHIALNKGGTSYNLAEGGTGGNTLKHLSDAKKQKVFLKRSASMRAYHASLSEEELSARAEAISASRKGQPGNRLGKPHTPETKAKQRVSNIIAASMRGPEWYERHASAMARRKGQPNEKAKKPVTIEGITYESVRDACEVLGVTRTTICNWRKNGKAT